MRRTSPTEAPATATAVEAAAAAYAEYADIALEHANDVGATVILVTNNLGEALRDRVSVVLTTPTGNAPMYKMQATTLALFEALVLAMAQQMTFAAVAKLVNESWHRVHAICSRYVDLALAEDLDRLVERADRADRP